MLESGGTLLGLRTRQTGLPGSVANQLMLATGLSCRSAGISSRLPRSERPVERNFASVKNKVNIPLDKVNKK